ncbi:hypothetical protein MMC13_001691 [Lambiella insularis]|nr:hypothetical protein [Lambiella insularis]
MRLSTLIALLASSVLASAHNFYVRDDPPSLYPSRAAEAELYTRNAYAGAVAEAYGFTDDHHYADLLVRAELGKRLACTMLGSYPYPAGSHCMLRGMTKCERCSSSVHRDSHGRAKNVLGQY